MRPQKADSETLFEQSSGYAQLATASWEANAFLGQTRALPTSRPSPKAMWTCSSRARLKEVELTNLSSAQPTVVNGQVEVANAQSGEANSARQYW
jgi:hypothetical protein